MTDDLRIGTLEAVLERLIPDDALGPGARAAGVVDYVVRRYAGVDGSAREQYAIGLAALDAQAADRGAEDFAGAAPELQDELLAAAEAAGLARSDASRGTAFFETVLRHAREGMFGDPVHGGNRGYAGWDLLGYPDARRVWRRDEQAIGAVVVPLTPRGALPPTTAGESSR
ncbi:MAG TPA: gluconate 2-dehydrogenase subunit 3 family protein [Microbacteriaceae bacterium]|nr:gluconate 2-dehydrogenase subunit 3 family protein [Microbacteriaceae bacterium]